MTWRIWCLGVMVVEDISPGKLVKHSTHLHLPTFVVVVRKSDRVAKLPVQNTTATVTLNGTTFSNRGGKSTSLVKKTKKFKFDDSAKFCVHS
jgi:hypothetical protein